VVVVEELLLLLVVEIVMVGLGVRLLLLLTLVQAMLVNKLELSLAELQLRHPIGSCPPGFCHISHAMLLLRTRLLLRRGCYGRYGLSSRLLERSTIERYVHEVVVLEYLSMRLEPTVATYYAVLGCCCRSCCCRCSLGHRCCGQY